MVTNKNINISIIQHPYTTWSTLLANLENIKCKKGFSISNEKKFWNSIPNMQLPPPFVACWLPILAHTTCCQRDKWGQKLLSSFSLGPWKKCLKERAKGRQWAHTPSHSVQRSQDVLHILISWASFSRHMLAAVGRAKLSPRASNNWCGKERLLWEGDCPGQVW